MRARLRDRRAMRRARPGGIAIPWFVVCIVLAIELFRQVMIQAAITMDGCEHAVFWLSGWEERRSVMQVTGAMIGGFAAWFALWLFGRDPWVVKALGGLLLLGWIVAYDRQMEMLLPDRPHPVAEFSRHLWPARPASLSAPASLVQSTPSMSRTCLISRPV